MSARRLLRFSAYREMHACAAAFVRQHAAASEMAVIAASKGAAGDLLRTHAAPGLLGVHTLTLGHAAAQLAAADLAAWGLAPMSQLGLEAVVARVIHTLRSRGELAYFAPVSDTPGFVRAVARTLAELRMESVSPEELARSGPPGADLARLSRLFAEQLQEQSLCDHATMFGMAVKAAREGRHRLLGLPLLLLDVPLRSDRQRELVEAIAGRAPAVLAVLLDADDESAAHTEGALGAPFEYGEPASVAATTLDRLRRQIFLPELEPGCVDSSLEVFSAAGESLECVEIARRIRTLAAAGTPYDRVAVLLRSPEKYQPLLEEALRRADIPAWFPRGTARPDPSGRAFLALLACAAENCSASRFAEYLSLAQVPDLDERGAPVRSERAFAAASQDEIIAAFQPAAAGDEVPPAAEDSPGPVLSVPVGWEQLLVDAAVVGGHDRWARRIRGLEQELRLRSNTPENDEDHTRRKLERQIRQLGVLEGFALPLIDQLDSLPRRAPWRDWLLALQHLAEQALRAPESVLAVLSELEPMAEVGPADLDEVYGVLEDRLRFLRRDPPARRYGRVFAGTIEEARGEHFDVVFLPGLAEGIFPRRAYEDPLLLDVYRQSLPQALTTRDRLVARERLLLHIAAAACASKLVVSYPRMDTAQSRPRVPSFYALEVVRAAEGRLPELREFQERAARAAPSRLGWPAPSDPAAAIDDTEYDIASLRRFEDLPLAQRKGVGRYLLEVNGHLARSLRARWLRWHTGWTWADGLVDHKDQPARALLEDHRLANRVFSATALQHYAACPYRFLLSAIHGLRERDELAAIEQMDPLTRGALFHEVQFEFFQALKRAGLLPLGKDALQKALDLADQTLDRMAAIYEERLAPAIARVWSSEVEEMRTDLRGWVRHLAVIDSDWTPLHFELAFGLPREAARDDASTEDEARVFEAVRLRGSIDLVEQHRLRGIIRITDHKTGRPLERVPAYVGGGTVLQPILYSLVAERLLGKPVASGRLFYCTQRGGYREMEVPATPGARQHLERVLQVIDESIENAFLPAAPARDACKLCDYRAVCGPREEDRLRRKPQERLAALRDIREMP